MPRGKRASRVYPESIDQTRPSPSSTPTPYYTRDKKRKCDECCSKICTKEDLVNTSTEVLEYAFALLVAWEWNAFFSQLWIEITNTKPNSGSFADIPLQVVFALIVTGIAILVIKLFGKEVVFGEDLC